MAGKLGLGHLETLVENLDRDLNLAGTTLTDPIIATSGSITQVGTNGAGEVYSLSSAATTGYGVHEYYEVISVATGDDNDVAGSASHKLPAGAIILDAALIPVEFRWRIIP